MQTTNTVMSHSHYDRKVWHDFIQDTLEGKSLDESAERFGFSHQTAFNMRHKVLLAISEASEINQEVLSEVSELDETYVLDSYKGNPVPESAGRKARKHGAKALKRGISSEQVCICAGVQRKGGAMAMTVNRAKPSIEELKDIFDGRISPGTLLLVDGLRGYDSLESFISESSEEVLEKYTQNILDALFFNFLKSDKECRYDRWCSAQCTSQSSSV